MGHRVFHDYRLYLSSAGACLFDVTAYRPVPPEQVRSVRKSTKVPGFFVEFQKGPAVFLMDDEIRRHSPPT